MPYSSSKEGPASSISQRRTSARLASKPTGTQSIPLKRLLDIETPDSDEYFSDSDDFIDIDETDEYLPAADRKKHTVVVSVKKPKRVKKSGVSILPTELLVWIFQYTEPKTLARLMLVCKRFNEILKADEAVLLHYLTVIDGRSGEGFENVTILGLNSSPKLSMRATTLMALYKQLPGKDSPCAFLNGMSWVL